MVKRVLKRAFAGVGVILGLALLGGGGFVWSQVRAFDASTARVYDVPLPQITRSTDPAVLARGKHLAESLGACVTCHGENLGGGRVEPMGPMGTIVIPNITTGRDGRGNLYSDAELARLVKHGLRRDGTTVRLMPAQDWAWWPDEDVVAVVSWVRAQPPVDGDPGVVELRAMAKVLDRVDSIPIDVARRIDHARVPTPPPPAPDAAYGAFVATSCRGCHGEHLSGGPIPGAPPGLPPPLNLTPDATGLGGWSYDDFMTVVREGKRRNGAPLNPFMPVDSIRNMNETETRALWAYLGSVPPRPYGQR
jgi:mono/diheme cytochrome c family protein